MACCIGVGSNSILGGQNIVYIHCNRSNLCCMYKVLRIKYYKVLGGAPPPPPPLPPAPGSHTYVLQSNKRPRVRWRHIQLRMDWNSLNRTETEVIDAHYICGCLIQCSEIGVSMPSHHAQRSSSSNQKG